MSQLKTIASITSQVFLLVVFLAGCNQPLHLEPDPFFDEWKAKSVKSKPYLPARKKLEQVETVRAGKKETVQETDKESVPTIDAIKASLPTQSITIRFIDQEVTSALRALGRLGKLNIIINPSVKGTINAHISETPWNVVFMGIIDTYSLILEKEDNLLRVITLEDMKLQVQKKTLQLEGEQVAPLITRVVKIEYSNPGATGSEGDQIAGIAKSIEPSLTRDKEGKPRGSVTVDTHSRSLIIREIEENMQTMLDLIHELDRPTPQILIEAHIVETTQDTARELGVQWGGLMAINNDRTQYITPGGINGAVDATTGAITYDSGVTGSARGGIGRQGFALDLPAGAINSINPASIGFLNFTSNGVLDIQLSALQQAGKVNILSRPSIATLDNNEAIIESGAEIPYQTVEDGEVKVEYKEATLKLTVTPHVISDNMVRLSILANKDEVDTSRTVLGNPYIIKKRAKTQLIVMDGTTVVIAGLSKERNTTGKYGVPGLKDVPGLGWLFKNSSSAAEFEDLLIFITPRILTKTVNASNN